MIYRIVSFTLGLATLLFLIFSLMLTLLALGAGLHIGALHTWQGFLTRAGYCVGIATGTFTLYIVLNVWVFPERNDPPHMRSNQHPRHF